LLMSECWERQSGVGVKRARRRRRKKGTTMKIIETENCGCYRGTGKCDRERTFTWEPKAEVRQGEKPDESWEKISRIRGGAQKIKGAHGSSQK